MSNIGVSYFICKVKKQHIFIFHPFFEGSDLEKKSTPDQIWIRCRNPSGKKTYRFVTFYYLCAGQTNVTLENVQDLLEATNFLQIKDLNLRCSDFMARNLDSSNCVAVLKLADTLSNDTLVQVRSRQALSTRRGPSCFSRVADPNDF